MAAVKGRAYGLSSRALAWYYRHIWGMTIGLEPKISRSARLDQTNPLGIKIGDYTAIGPNVTILTHDFVLGRHLDVTIGSNCLIGARSIILPGVSIGDGSIVGAGSVVFTDVPPNSVVTGNPARIAERDITTGKWGIRNRQFLEMESIEVRQKRRRELKQAGNQAAALRVYLPDVTDFDATFDQLGIDSFSLITLRAQIEEGEGTRISDDDWLEIERPSDLLAFIGQRERKPAAAAGRQAGGAKRSHTINMPQMAMRGLSESWLFKELGDIHWSVLTNSLGVRSRDIADERGNRLYATFTRIRYSSTIPLGSYRENDTLRFEANMSRMGAGMFFSTITADSETGSLHAELMSSFSMFGENEDNTSLVKGQPVLPLGFPIPNISELPEFAIRYRERRAGKQPEPIFTTDYEILPQHDINGVGLLYFAAYPSIADVCLMRYMGQAEHGRWSSVHQDVCYFANSGASERLRYAIHSFDRSDIRVNIVASISRASDGKRMALVETEMKLR
jgi:probable biosynthetic protein (TIGR04098 family)